MYPRLTSELRIGNMRVRNRIMLAAMGTELCELGLVARGRQHAAHGGHLQ